MNKIIFLDVDGVINLLSKQWASHHLDHYEHFVEGFDRKSLFYLQEIVQGTGAKVVLSAACRKIDEYCNAVYDFLKKYYNIECIGRTPGSRDGFRGGEVYEWLNDRFGPYGQYRYAILDDEGDFFLEQLPFLFQTDPEYGITENIAYRVKYHLNNGKGIRRKDG
uniref:Uncharacterized protein n=1 Tax=Ochrobactrum phage ORM_20 TaxID=2985243 RepID=A0A9N6WVC5_9VIRU|nr:hypothetical protein ORM20_00108 [Ochrobactrum phage ORM_20]